MMVAALIAIVLLAYWPSTYALWRYWTSDPYLGGHGLAVAVIAVCLLYRARHRIAATAVHPLTWMVPLLLACSIASLVLFRAGIQALQLLLLPALMLLAILTALGPQLARIMLVPIAFVYFGMPAWNLLSVPLQLLTLRVVAVLAPVLGLPAKVVGPLITFGNGTAFEVTMACSGVGFLVDGLAVATLIGELERASVRRRLGLLASMVLVALVSNWIRVLVIVQFGYATAMRSQLATRHHLLFGWMLFVLALIGFVWLTTRSPRANVRTGWNGGERGLAHERVHPVKAFSAAVAALVVAPLLVAVVAVAHSGGPVRQELRMPAGHASWRGPLETEDSAWHPVFVGSHTEQRAAYEDGIGHQVEVVVVGYSMQEQGRELVNEGNSLLGSGGLTAVATDIVQSDGHHYWEVVALDDRNRQSVIWSIYDIGGRTFVTPLLSQLWYGLRALGEAPYSALFALRSDCAPSCVEARVTLASFVRSMGPELVAAPARTSPRKRLDPA